MHELLESSGRHVVVYKLLVRSGTDTHYSYPTWAQLSNLLIADCCVVLFYCKVSQPIAADGHADVDSCVFTRIQGDVFQCRWVSIKEGGVEGGVLF